MIFKAWMLALLMLATAPAGATEDSSYPLGSIEIKMDDLMNFVFDQQFLTGAQGFVADLHRYESIHPDYVFGPDDPKLWTDHLLHDKDVAALLEKDGLTPYQLELGMVDLSIWGIGGGGIPHKNCDIHANVPPGKEKAELSRHFLCIHADEFEAMSKSWLELK